MQNPTSQAIQPQPAQPPPKPSDRMSQEPLRRREPPGHTLVFAPAAWLKLMFFLHAGETEVGGFAVTAERDPLYVEQFVTVKQLVSAVSVEFDDDSVADHFDACVDAGLKPDRFARVWVHTHPGDSPRPSFTDEHTFARVFGACDWALMFIVSRTGRTYARLAFRAGPGAEVLLGVAVDWAAWPQSVLEDQGHWDPLLVNWAEEFERNVQPADLYPANGYADEPLLRLATGQTFSQWGPAEDLDAYDDSDGDPAADWWLDAGPLRLFGGNVSDEEVPA